VLNVSGALGGLKNEMLLMSQLDVMLSMDSANMHIASILGTPVISIWGATHPKAGFSGYGQDSRNEQQLSLPCRPCSIYGKKPCQFGDLRCMNIAPETIVKATLNLLQDTSSHA
jgi:ADP-heptose:LPS heptosyltransferase